MTMQYVIYFRLKGNHSRSAWLQFKMRRNCNISLHFPQKGVLPWQLLKDIAYRHFKHPCFQKPLLVHFLLDKPSSSMEVRENWKKLDTLFSLSLGNVNPLACLHGECIIAFNHEWVTFTCISSFFLQVFWWWKKRLNRHIERIHTTVKVHG